MTEQEFTQMVRQYERLVYTVCFQLVRDAPTAEDLAQDTFLSAWAHRGACPAGAQKAWLCRIAVNKAKDHLKSAAHRRTQTVEDEVLAAVRDAVPGPEQIVEAQDGARRLAGAVANLAQPYRAVCVPCLLQGFSAQEVAAALGRPRRTVNTQLYRARHTLKKLAASA